MYMQLLITLTASNLIALNLVMLRSVSEGMEVGWENAREMVERRAGANEAVSNYPSKTHTLHKHTHVLLD